jgi:hypothetical protein
LSHSSRYTAGRQATQRRRISRLRPIIRFYSFCFFRPKVSPRLMSRTADAGYRAQSANDKEQARTHDSSQRPLFQPFIRYQPALLSRPSRVKCPIPDITLASPAKRAQRAIAADSLWEAAIDNFVTRENIKRYRRLVGESTDPSERSRIMTLLAEEESKATADVCRQGDAPERRSPVNAATENPVEHDGEGQRNGS